MITDISDLIQVLERADALVARSALSDCLFEAVHFVQLVARDPRLSAIFDELCESAHARAAAVVAVDDQCVATLVQLRKEIAREFPNVDDDAEHPAPSSNADPAWLDHRWTMAWFDHVVAERRGRITLAPPTSSDRHSLRSPDLAALLLHKLEAVYGERSIGFVRKVNFVREKLNVALREWEIFLRVDPAAASARLRAKANWARETYFRQEYEPLDRRSYELAGAAAYGFGRLRDYALDPAKFLDENQRHELIELAGKLKSDVGRVHEGIRANLVLARSRFVLIERFRQRAQLYERDDLRRIALENAGSVEEALTRRLALFLFDHGLNPVTKANLGNVQPDLLDVAGDSVFYVEAKQYQDSHGRGTIREGVAQICSTLLRTKALARPVREAFLVVFRIDGPLYEFEGEVEFDGVVVRPVLVDLAPSNAVGSRQKRSPGLITRAELRPPALAATHEL